MQSNNEVQCLAIVQTTNETTLEDLNYVRVGVDDILCIRNEPFEEKLEQLKSVFQRLHLNANALRKAKTAWTQAGYWITQSRKPFATCDACGVRQTSEHELFRFGMMSNYLRKMGMQSMPVLLVFFPTRTPERTKPEP
jgi:hypothetical protein